MPDNITITTYHNLLFPVSISFKLSKSVRASAFDQRPIFPAPGKVESLNCNTLLLSNSVNKCVGLKDETLDYPAIRLRYA